MCGIAGWINLTQNEKSVGPQMQKALNAMKLRGPDNQNFYEDKHVCLGHARLSILDTSAAGNQPMYDPSGRFAIIFNGEIFNYLELKKDLENQGFTFQTGTDTEILLALYKTEKENFIPKLNGFFSFVIYDKEEKSVLIARDRMGIKPFLIYQTESELVFASEMKALLAFGIPKVLDYSSIYLYFNLNYLPPNSSIFQGVTKLKPGNYLKIQNGKIEEKTYYKIPDKVVSNPLSYEKAQDELLRLLEDSVQKRLISDVPLGVFLSGGIDSSVIATLAARHQKNLQTFSIGFANPVYDETQYAKMVAKKAGTDHTVFTVTEKDLFENLKNVLDYIDEPFADASANNFHLLSKFTKQKVTVALSGDGADELFGGYSKHLAEYKIRQGGFLNTILKMGKPIIDLFPGNRNSKINRKIWQVQKYCDGLADSPQNRYWKWCSVGDPKLLNTLLKFAPNLEEVEKRKKQYMSIIKPNGDMNDVLLADLNLVLGGDMLTKADLMSMANSLEVRVPFLDYRIVDFAASLPADYKLCGNMRKRILQDASRKILPAELYNRPKQGFEVPLADWFKTEMKTFIETEILDKKFIEEQGIFNFEAIKSLYEAILKGENGKEDWTLWSIIVFQNWYKRYYL